MLLSTDEDFGIILEALDAFASATINLSMATEMASVALAEAIKLPDDEQISDKAFAQRVEKSMNKEKVKDKSAQIKDKIIVMKAKVVMTKEYLRGAKLENEIDTLLG